MAVPQSLKDIDELVSTLLEEISLLQSKRDGLDSDCVTKEAKQAHLNERIESTKERYNLAITEFDSLILDHEFKKKQWIDEESTVKNAIVTLKRELADLEEDLANQSRDSQKKIGFNCFDCNVLYL